MRTAFALLLLAASVPGQSARDGSGNTVVALEDGSFFLARTGVDAIALKTPYGEQRVPLQEIRSLRRAGESEFTLRTAQVSLTGDLARPEFEFETALGRLRVPSGDVRLIASGNGLAVLMDSPTAALWSFGEAQGGVCTDLVKGRRLVLNDLDVSADPDGVVSASRRSENGYAEVASDADLEFPADALTLEARVKVGTTQRGYTSIVWKSDGRSCDYCLLVQAGGSLYVGANNNNQSFSVATPQGVLKPNEWCYVAVVAEPRTRTVTFYVNGKQVHQAPGQFQPLVQTGTPLFIGAAPPASGNFASPESLQFVRISRVARTAEEIREWNAVLESTRNLSGAGMSPGATLRDGGFLRAKFPSLSGTSFRTAWGSLKLTERMGGQITLFRYRPGRLAAVEAEAKETVRRLGALGIDERDEALARLTELAEVAVPYLKEALNDKDSEVRSRSAALLKKFEASGVAGRPASDVLRLGRTVLHGWLEAEALDVGTGYGTLRAPADRLQALSLGPVTPRGKRIFTLTSGEKIQADPPGDATLDLETSFGPLSIPFREVTHLDRPADKTLWSVKTERLTASGKLAAFDVTLETPAGPVVVPITEVQQVAVPGVAAAAPAAPVPPAPRRGGR